MSCICYIVRGACGSSDQRDLRPGAGVQIKNGVRVSDAFQAMVGSNLSSDMRTACAVTKFLRRVTVPAAAVQERGNGRRQPRSPETKADEKEGLDGGDSERDSNLNIDVQGISQNEFAHATKCNLPVSMRARRGIFYVHQTDISEYEVIFDPIPSKIMTPVRAAFRAGLRRPSSTG